MAFTLGVLVSVVSHLPLFKNIQVVLKTRAEIM